MRYVNVFIKSFVLITILFIPVLVWGQVPAPGAGGVRPGGDIKPPAGSVRLPTVETPAPKQPPLPSREGKPNGEKKEEAAAIDGNKEKKGDEAPEGAGVAGDRVYLNVQDQDIKDVIRQISKATGKNFIIDSKIAGKVTIMSEKTMTKEEAYQAFLSALEVAGFTTVMGPGGIIKIVSLKEAVSSPIPIHVDTTPYTDSYVTRLISLKNISALDMSNAIKGLISKSGNMFAYPSTNTLIITDSGTNIDRLMKIIKELDQEGPQQVLEIIQINHADAKDIAAKVLSLYDIDKGAGQARPAARPGGAVELEELKDVSKIIADDRTNSLIVLASKRAIDRVRDIIAKLDVPLKTGDTGTIHVHYLKYAKATELAATLSAITSGAKAAMPAKPKEGEKGKPAEKGPSPVAQLEGGVSIGADEKTNALIITASAKDYQTIIDELISKLDIPSRQVYLEAIVMELEIDKNKTVGVSGFGGAGNKSVLGFGNTSVGGFNALQGLFDPTSFFGTPGLLGGLLSRDTVTIDVPTKGGTTQVTIPAFAAFLNMIQTYRDANIVSTPNIMTVDNQKASIEVMRKQYIAQNTTIATAGSVLSGSQPVEAGLTLEITPQITEGNAVRMEIHNKLSNFTGKPAAPGLGPPETRREITTTVVAMDGQTVVLGGLMQDLSTHDKSKVPILGDIPLIGLLFRSSTTSNNKNNLLVFVTPHVVKDPSDFAEISKTKIGQRNKFIEQNYGKRQQQSIRDTIAAHRADLLEFIPPPGVSLPPSTSAVQIPLPATALPPAAATTTTTKAPVITVGSPNAPSGGSLNSQSSISEKSAKKSSKSSKPKTKVNKEKPVSATDAPKSSQNSAKPKEAGDVDTAY